MPNRCWQLCMRRRQARRRPARCVRCTTKRAASLVCALRPGPLRTLPYRRAAAAHHASRVMAAQKGGLIVNVSFAYPSPAPSPYIGHLLYDLSKVALCRCVCACGCVLQSPTGEGRPGQSSPVQVCEAQGLVLARPPFSLCTCHKGARATRSHQGCAVRTHDGRAAAAGRSYGPIPRAAPPTHMLPGPRSGCSCRRAGWRLGCRRSCGRTAWLRWPSRPATCGRSACCVTLTLVREGGGWVGGWGLAHILAP